MSAEVVEAIRAELLRRGFEPDEPDDVDDEEGLVADVLVLDDLQLMVEPVGVLRRELGAKPGHD